MSETVKLDLKEVIHKHKLWLCEKGGRRANLEGADLRDADLMGANLMIADLMSADLRGTDLRFADLRDADLRDANLMGANLRDANLMSADLRGADLRGAYLSGAKGFYLIPVQDPRGYPFPHAVLTNQGWRVRAGCRTLSIAEAREHWGDSYVGERWIGDMYLHACRWLESMINENSVKALAGKDDEG